jgi:hypothetical protein
VKMEDQALQHIMNVQTQMLQQLTTLQQQQGQNQLNVQAQTLSGQTETTAFGTPLPGSVASPTVPPSIDPMVAPGTLSMSVGDPTQYGTYAAPYLGSGRPVAAQIGNEAKGFLSNSIAQIREFDGTRSSKEATDRFITQQSRGLQERAADVTGGVLTGATTAASFFIPGLIPSLAVGAGVAMGVGGFTSAISDETRVALDYQDLLQKQSYRFLNAFESTNDMGGIGMGLTDRQEVSSFLRDLAPEKFLQDSEMMSILQGATDNNLLKSVSDVKSFKKKFTEVVDAVKEITITMNQSIEEATAFMGEMESRGISTKDMSYLSARTKTMSSMLGISATEGAGVVLQATDNVTSGTSIDSGRIMESTQENIYFAQRVQDWASENNEGLYDLIKNSGGAKSVGPAFQQTGRNYSRSETGTSMLMGYFGGGFTYNEATGAFEVNDNAMQNLLSGNVSEREMRSQSQAFLTSLTAPQRHQLQGTVGTVFNNFANSGDISSFMERVANLIIERQSQNGQEIDMNTALMEAGMAADYDQAMLLEGMINASTNDNYRQSFTAKSIKEEMDANAISNSPGLGKRIQFWWEKNVTNNVGDIGQSVSDATGQILLEHEKFITGIDDRSTVGATSLESFSLEGLENLTGRMESMNRSAEGIMEEYGYKGWGSVDDKDILKGKVNVESLKEQLDIKDNEDFSSEAFETYLSQLKKGQLDATSMAKLSSDEDLGFFGGIRANFIQDVAQGKYEGFLGGMKYGVDRTVVGAYNGIESLYDSTIGDWIKAAKGDTSNIEEAGNADGTYKSLEKQREKLTDEKQNINEEVMALFGSGALGKDQSKLKEIEKMIESGNVGGLKGLTSNKEATALAERYKTLMSLESDYGEGMSDFTEMSKYTKALATSGTQLGDLLNASGVYTEAEIDDLLGDLRSDGKKTNKKLKKNKLSVNEMALANRDAINEIDNIFNSMPEYNLHELTSYLAKKDSSIKMEQFYEKGTQNIDADLVKEYLMDNVIRQSHLKTENEDPKEKSDSKDTKKAAKEHEEAMVDFLTAFQNEAAMLRDATAGKPINPNQTSLSTPR